MTSLSGSQSKNLWLHVTVRFKRYKIFKKFFLFVCLFFLTHTSCPPQTQGNKVKYIYIDIQRNSKKSKKFIRTTVAMSDIPENSETSTPDVKPDIKSDVKSETHLNLKVSDGSSEIFFKIKRTTSLRRLMEAFAKRQGKEMDSLRFLYDGIRIQADQTPDDLDMEDNDIIEAHREQIGGNSI